MPKHTVAPGLHHQVHSALSVLGAPPPVPVTLFVVLAVLLVAAVVAVVGVVHFRSDPYVRRPAGTAADVMEEAR